MKKTSNSIDISTRVTLVILGASLLTGAASWRKPGVVASEVKPKSQVQAIPSSGRRLKRVVVDTGRTYPNEPIELIALKLGGNPIGMSQGIDADLDWLDGLEWEIKNISKKNILTIDLYLIFPDIEIQTGKMFVYPMRYGYDPKLPDKYNQSGFKEALKPSESAKFAISNAKFTALKPLLESKIPLSEIRHLRIRFELIVFEDDTAWSLGEDMRRDPGNMTWIPVQK